MEEEDEALGNVPALNVAQHLQNEERLDEADESEATKLEEYASHLEGESRRAELEGNWQKRDELREAAKSYRYQATLRMKSISNRHGRTNFSTGM